MVKDRLPELRGARCKTSDEVVYIYPDKEYDDITQYLQKVEKLLSVTNNIQTHNEEIKHLSNILISLPHGSDKYSFEVENRKAAVSQLIKNGKNILKELKQEVQKAAWQKESDVFMRIKDLQFATSVQLLISAVQEYNTALLKHRERCKAIVQQQMKICDKVVTNEELEDLLERNKSEVFVENIVSDTLEAQKALSQIKSRYEELQKIEDSISQLRDTFVQMGTLIEAQGDNISRIEHYVLKAQDYTEHGNKKLEKAKTSKKKAKKRNRILIIILVILLGIIIIMFVV